MPRFEGNAAQEKPASERRKRPSLRVVEGGKRERVRTLRKTEEEEKLSHLDALRRAGEFGGTDAQEKTIRTLHAGYGARMDELMEKEQEIRSRLEDILGPLEGSTPEEIRAHHLSGMNKVKDWLTSITGRKNAKESAAPLLKKLQAIQNEKAELHEKQIDVSITSLRMPPVEYQTRKETPEESDALIKRLFPSVGAVPETELEARLKQKREESEKLERKLFPPVEETLGYQEKQEIEKRTNEYIEMLGGVKEGMSNSEAEQARARGRAEGTRLWDEVNRTVQLMNIPDTDFTAMDYVELAAKMQKAEAGMRPEIYKNIKLLLAKMNDRLGYAAGQDPLTGAGMGASRMLEMRGLGQNRARNEQEGYATRATGMESRTEELPHRAEREKQTNQPLTLEWAKTLLTPDAASRSWNEIQSRMIFDREQAKAIVGKRIDSLAGEINGIKDLESSSYKNFNAIKNISQGDPAEATMYVMLKALAEGNINLSDGDRDAAAAVRRALSDIDRELIAAAYPDRAKKEQERQKREELAGELIRLGKEPFIRDMEEETDEPAENAILHEPEQLERSTPDHVIEALVYGLPKKASEDYTLALRKFYGTNDMDKQFAILRVLRNLDVKYKLEGSKTAERIRKTLMERMLLSEEEKNKAARNRRLKEQGAAKPEKAEEIEKLGKEMDEIFEPSAEVKVRDVFERAKVLSVTRKNASVALGAGTDRMASIDLKDTEMDIDTMRNLLKKGSEVRVRITEISGDGNIKAVIDIPPKKPRSLRKAA